MANHLKVATVHSILTLRKQGWSQRRIAAALGVDRGTVARHVWAALGSKAANAPPGSACANAPPGPLDADGVAAGGSNAANALTGSDPSKPANAPAGSAGRISDCEPYRDFIQAKFDQGLSAIRIHQDLGRDFATDGEAPVSYHSVRRFVQRLHRWQPSSRRQECRSTAAIASGSCLPCTYEPGNGTTKEAFDTSETRRLIQLTFMTCSGSCRRARATKPSLPNLGN